jgi:TolB-like protein
MSLFTELHRRNVVRVGVAYAVTAWLLLQVADVVMENIGAPPWVMQALLFVLLIGVIPALLFAWVFELTPEGIKRESEISASDSVVHHTRRKLDTLIIVLLVGTVGYFIWETRLRDTSGDAVAETTSEKKARGLREAPADYSPNDKSIAVLPFVNLSSDPEQEFFSDGISEELLNVLAQIPQLRVAARTSSFQFKGDNRDIGEIAELLNVDHVLEGSVRKSGSRLRITAQLIEAEQGFHLWSNTYDRELSDIFAIQDEISLAIADALRAELALGSGITAAHVAETSNSAAYEAFLKGRALLNKRGNIAITQAVRELEKSVRLDPDYAPARAQLAIAIALLTNSSGTYGDLTLAEVNERAGEQLLIAERLDPAIAEIWAAKTLLALLNTEDQLVLGYADSALAIRPNYVDVMNWKVNALRGIGSVKEEMAAREYLLEIDPLSVIGRLNAVSAIGPSDPERAKRIAESIAAQSPWASHTALAQFYAQQNEAAKELENLLLAYAIDEEDLFVNAQLQYLFARYGFDEEAMRVDRDARVWALLETERYEEAEDELRQMIADDPDAVELQTALAEALWFQQRFDEAVVLWRAAMVDTVHGQLVFENGGFASSLRMLWVLRRTGDDNAAAALQATLRARFAAEDEAAGVSANRYLQNAVLAEISGDSDSALAALQESVDRGLDDLGAFDGIVFENLQGAETFEAIRRQAESANAKNRADVLTLMCENNPVPDHWRPLASSCVLR